MSKLAIAFCLLLAGCGVDMIPLAWDKAVELCASNGGLRGANWNGGGANHFVEARCENGVVAKIMLPVRP